MNILCGTFWVDPEIRKSGTLSREQDGTFLLELEGYIFWPEQLKRYPDYIEQSDDPANIVADFWPRDIQGILDSGEPISLMGALMQQPLGSIGQQRFEVPAFVSGASLRGKTDQIDGIRWRWRIPALAAGWVDNPTSRVTGDLAGDLSPWNNDGCAGLQLLLDDPHPLDATLTQARENSGQLLGLACFNIPPKATRTELLVDDGWYEYETPGEDLQPQFQSQLLPLNGLTVSVFAAWLPVAGHLHPFPFMVNSLTRTLQLDALILGTLLEGLHQRLHRGERPLVGISNNGVERAVEAGREAILRELEVRGCQNMEVANKLIRESLAHLNKPNYQARAEALLAPVRELVPSLFGPEMSDWIERTKTIRNAQSHQIPLNFDEEKVRQYYVFMESCKWAVILRVLLEVFPEDQIKGTLYGSRAFRFALANIDREDLWPGFSALRAFATNYSGRRRR